METQLPFTATESQLALIQKKLVLDQKIRAGTNWFFWIGALSIINSIVFLVGAGLHFFVGLAATQVIDAITEIAVNDLGAGWTVLRYMGFGADLVIASVFVLFGILGRRGHRWIILVGMALYAVDAVAMLFFQEYFSAAFHLLALVSIFGSLSAIKQLRILEAAGSSESIEQLRQRLPQLDQKPTSSSFKRAFRKVILTFCVLVLLVFFGIILYTALW